jgi:putative tricarboxylic transport membrane protein
MRMVSSGGYCAGYRNRESCGRHGGPVMIANGAARMTNLNFSSDWRPQREIELIAGTPPGGGQDRPARVLIELLKDRTGVPIKLTNIAGRGGGNAWDHLAARPGDPHVLAINSPTIITNRLMGESELDFAALTPLANLYTEYLAFVVRPPSALRSPADLLGALARDPAAIRIAFATAIGNMNHIALAKIARQAGADALALVTDVFDSARYAVAHVVEGRAELAVISATSAVPELTSGALRAIAVSAPARLSAPFAEVPTWGDVGIDCVVGTWRGVIGTGAITPPQAAFWESVLRSAVRGEAWRAELARHHWVDTWRDAAATRDFLERELDTMRGALGALGLIAGISYQR